MGFRCAKTVSESPEEKWVHSNGPYQNHFTLEMKNGPGNDKRTLMEPWQKILV